MGHILQVCPRTHASRVARHDKIVDLVASGACRNGWGVWREPAIPTPAGIRRPDLILDHQDTVIVLDVTIVADNADLYEAHQHKCDYYDQPAIRDWVSRNISIIPPTFSSVTPVNDGPVGHNVVVVEGGQASDPSVSHSLGEDSPSDVVILEEGQASDPPASVSSGGASPSDVVKDTLRRVRLGGIFKKPTPAPKKGAVHNLPPVTSDRPSRRSKH